MKSAIFATAFALAIAVVSAQLDLSSIPSCASSCALTSLTSTQCQTSDLNCVCHDSQFIDTLKPCIIKDCDTADQQKMVSVAASLCSSYSVTIPSDILSATPTASGAAASSTETITSGTSTGTTTTTTRSTTTSTSTGTNAAAKMTGSGFVAAAMGAAAMFVL